jgi:hypothetical protein
MTCRTQFLGVGLMQYHLFMLWLGQESHGSLLSAADGQLLNRLSVGMEPEDTSSSSETLSNGSPPEPFQLLPSSSPIILISILILSSYLSHFPTKSASPVFHLKCHVFSFLHVYNVPCLSHYTRTCLSLCFVVYSSHKTTLVLWLGIQTRRKKEGNPDTNFLQMLTPEQRQQLTCCMWHYYKF